MPNNLIKSESSSIEPATFEELDPESTHIIRARERSNRKATSSYTPPLARNVLRKSIAELKADPVDLFQSWPAPKPAPAPIALQQERSPEDDWERTRKVERDLRDTIRREFESSWQPKLEHAEETARAEGYEQGYAAAKKDLEDEFFTAKKHYQEGLQRLRDTWGGFISRSETLLLEIAVEIAQFLIDVPLPERFSKLTEEALVEALENLSHDVPIRLSLNPVDLMRLQESGMARFVEEQFPTLRWDPQATLKEGNWIIQTPRQAIRRVSEELIENLRDRFGLHESASSEEENRPAPPAQKEQHIPPVTNISVTTTTLPEAFQERLRSSMTTSPSSITTTAISPDAFDTQ